eukprot:TRINITY_DN6067_c0_g1_i7.p1 TRINITY_DN6067_c0_g1~~TRINITY_DN6067_c0_g1_i7.p1  ORF type:complete len:148 (+),score=15.86 TRINITY_DN6067_c0_g1_i7:1-444(+)
MGDCKMDEKNEYVSSEALEKDEESRVTFDIPRSADGPKKSVRQVIIERVGFPPRDAFGWLYACRGFYKAQEYHLCAEGITHCLRHEKTTKEAQHLLAFSLLHLGQPAAAAAAFFRSVKLGNHSDWQALVELCIDNPTIKLTGNGNQD